MLKKTGKFMLRALLGILVFFGFYFLFAFLLTIIPANAAFNPTKGGNDLYIISNGVHTDLCFPIRNANLEWDKILDFSQFNTPPESIRYLSFGWGDKGFYFDTPTWADLSAKTALTAAFVPSPTAMHVSVLSETPVLGERIRKTEISEMQLQKIEQFINNSFQKKAGAAQLIDCCRYEGYDDNFYEAKGSYHMFYTCNTWTNEGLKKGGIKTANWAPFDKCVLYHF